MKDSLYQGKQRAIAPFEFNETVTQVFDDMLQRSVPQYNQVLQSICSISESQLKQGSLLCDLGCSTGNALIKIHQALPHLQLELIGVDNSLAMIKKAQEKAKAAKLPITFQCADLLQTSLPDADAFLMQYTLQFIPVSERLSFLKTLRKKLKPEGFLILSEKICFSVPKMDQFYIDQYLKFKKQNGYSELEIAQKREALENVLVPLTLSQNITLLQQAGFSKVEPFFQWFNFVSFLCFE